MNTPSLGLALSEWHFAIRGRTPTRSGWRLAVRGRMTRVGGQIDPESMDLTLRPRCATVDGFSLHANVAVHAGDRPRLERLARYCARAPIAMDRLERLVDGRLLYRFKRPWRDGTTHIVMEPMELLEKLSALVPAPRSHLVRYSGVLAPASKWRPLIVPEPAIPSTIPPDTADATQRSRTDSTATPAATAQQALQPGPCRHGRNYTWAELMKRVWELDVLECPRCRGRMKIVAAINSPNAIQKILNCLGLPSRAPWKCGCDLIDRQRQLMRPIPYLELTEVFHGDLSSLMIVFDSARPDREEEQQ